MTRGQIGSVIDLDRDVLDELLAVMVQSRLLAMAVQIGLRTYRVIGL